MHQYVCLDIHGGRWRLPTGNLRGHVGSWVDEEVTLTQLTEEGWMIDGPYPMRLSTG